MEPREDRARLPWPMLSPQLCVKKEESWINDLFLTKRTTGNKCFEVNNDDYFKYYYID